MYIYIYIYLEDLYHLDGIDIYTSCSHPQDLTQCKVGEALRDHFDHIREPMAVVPDQGVEYQDQDAESSDSALEDIL